MPRLLLLTIPKSASNAVELDARQQRRLSAFIVAYDTSQ